MIRFGVCTTLLFAGIAVGGCQKGGGDQCYKKKDPSACRPLCKKGRARAGYALGERYWYTSYARACDLGENHGCVMARQIARRLR